jgi:membrane-associated phospholipid phosphatase
LNPVLFAKAKHRLLAAFLLAAACGTGFAAISFFNRERFAATVLPTLHALWLDHHIPFVSEWVWVYLCYYPFCFLPAFFWKVRNDPQTFRRTLAAYGLQFGVSFALFLMVPLRMVHAEVPPGLNGQILSTMYAFDSGFSSFPSLHVANVVFVAILVNRLQGKLRGLGVSVIALLIAISTLLVKQHFVADVITGALLGWGSFALTFSGLDPQGIPTK